MCHGLTRLPTPAYVSALGAYLLVAVAGSTLVCAGEPEYPTSRLGVRTARILLLSRPDVRAELTLTPEQAASAERAISDLYVRAAALKGKSGPEVIAARRAIDDDMEKWAETQLTDAQRTRFEQIDLQWEGPAAMVTRPIMADTLGLSATQRQELAQAVAERNRKRSQGQYGPADERKLFDTAMRLLTPEQKTRWRAMLGRPFEPQVAAAPGPPQPKR